MRVFYAFVTITAIASCCIENGKSYRDGDEWSTGQFLKKCVERSVGDMYKYTAIKIIACLTPSEEVIELDEKRMVGNTLYTCTKNPDGSVKLSSRTIIVSPYEY